VPKGIARSRDRAASTKSLAHRRTAWATRLRSPDARSVVALLATRGRFDLLALRAIPSILAQSRLPDRILVVVDQSLRNCRTTPWPSRPADSAPSAAEGPADRDAQPANPSSRVGRVEHRNRPATPRIRQPDLVFVAILDDDDAWEPNHLECCLDAALARDLNMVASGLIRHEADGDLATDTRSRASSIARELFVRGQHIQGSNLFVRLDLLLLAGGFDERLPSCTDRDLCLRLVALEELRFGSTDRHTVHHYADPRPDRLSTPVRPPSWTGLTRFFRKHGLRFDAATRNEAEVRASERFGWTPVRSNYPCSCRRATRRSPSETLDLVVGFVTDALVPPTSAACSTTSCGCRRSPGIRRLKVVIVENGPLPAGARPLHDLARTYSARGLPIEVVTIERQREDWERGALLDVPDMTRRRLPIAATRSILNTYVARSALAVPGAAAWILDDDKRLSIPRGSRRWHLDRALTPDVAPCCSSGARSRRGDRPRHGRRAAAVRRDAAHAARRPGLVVGRSPNSLPMHAWPDRRAEWRPNATRCATATTTCRRLDGAPGDAVAAASQSTIGSADAQLQWAAARRSPGCWLASPCSARSLVHARDLPLEAAADSVQRGGSALFFNPAHLLLYPQTLARVGDQFVRRSDMLVSQLMRDQAGLRLVVHPCVGVRHDRSSTARATFASETTAPGCAGLRALPSGERVDAGAHSRTAEGPRCSHGPTTELRLGVRLVRKYRDERARRADLERVAHLRLGWRIRTAARRIATNHPAWASAESRAALDTIASRDGSTAQRVPTHRRCRVFRAHSRQRERRGDPRCVRVDGWLDREYRATHAASMLDVRPSRRLARLARAVLRGVTSAMKRSACSEWAARESFHRRAPGVQGARLAEASRSITTPRRRCALSGARADCRRHVYLPELTTSRRPARRELSVRAFRALLRRPRSRADRAVARAEGARRRVQEHAPKNLRVTTSGLRLIDYGADIRPFSDDGYRSMAERAWLSWRWAHRPDLDVLMRRALQDKNLPELDGFERFWRAALRRDVRRPPRSRRHRRPDRSRIGCAQRSGLRVREEGAQRARVCGCRTAHGRLRSRCRRRGALGELGELPAGCSLTADREEALGRGSVRRGRMHARLCASGRMGPTTSACSATCERRPIGRDGRRDPLQPVRDVRRADAAAWNPRPASRRPLRGVLRLHGERGDRRGETASSTGHSAGSSATCCDTDSWSSGGSRASRWISNGSNLPLTS
jgi:hypothetical protein